MLSASPSIVGTNFLLRSQPESGILKNRKEAQCSDSPFSSTEGAFALAAVERALALCGDRRRPAPELLLAQRC